MSTTGRLDLHLEEPGEDVLADQVFDILQSSLQPDCEAPMASIVDQLRSLLPQGGEPYTSQVTTFLCCCYEVAEQIPYSHQSMDKLVTIIYLCLNSASFTGYRYQKLGETLYDWLTGEFI